MYTLDENTIERIYAGWLGKIIGIRLGAPVEGWDYDKIQRVYGELWDYPVDYRDFAADDDSNGPIFLVRALEHSGKGAEMTAGDVADALLNYAAYEHGFFWWGGYGVSTEHTAYLNLRSGIEAPQSGSRAMNGEAISEQIGGQIFIDPWGLVAPGNPELAAKLAREAASVTHDGNGIWGGVFVAACISLAFLELPMEEMLHRALAYLPADCEYARVVTSVMDFHRKDAAEDWRACFAYVREHFGYDKYPGYCHIIPNATLIVLALLYGRDDYSRTICICNMCGWDTDCNVGNVGTIMGVRTGLDGIPYEKWRRPVNDLLICSSVVGSLNIMDIPYGAAYMAREAFALAGQEAPAAWRDILEQPEGRLHFEYPGSTHALRLRVDGACTLEGHIANTEEQAHSGRRSLKLFAAPLEAGQPLYLYQKTWYDPEDLHDDRYEPGFSPLIYPGQSLSGYVFLPEGQSAVEAQMYVKDRHSGRVTAGEKRLCPPGQWQRLAFDIPPMEGALLAEAGFMFTVPGNAFGSQEFTAYVDDMTYGGTPDYSVDFARESLMMLGQSHYEVSQFTKAKGWTWLEDGWLHLTGTDWAETYTGSHRFADYTLHVTLKPILGAHHFVNLRVQGALYSYAVGFSGEGRLVLCKNDKGLRELDAVPFSWRLGKEHTLRICVKGRRIEVGDGSSTLLAHTDENRPYLTGGVGFSVQEGSHCSYKGLQVSGPT